MPDAEIRVDGAALPGRPAEYLGDGRYRVAGLTAGPNCRLRAFRRKLPTRTETGQLEIKPGQTTDAGELRLEWEEGLAGDTQPRFRLENGGEVNLAFSPDGATLASISTPAAANDKSDDVKLIDAATGKVLETARIPAVCIAYFPNSNRLALGCSDGTVVLTNEKKLTTWKSFLVSNSAAYAYGLAVSPNGAMIACCAGDGTAGSFTVDCWNVASGRKMHTLEDKGMPTISLAFSPDNKLLVTVDSFGLCKAWDLESEIVLGSFQIVHDNNRFAGDHIDSLSISFCPDGKTSAIAVHYYHGARPGQFAGGRNDGNKRDELPPDAETLQFWDPRGGKPPVVVSLPDEIKPKLDPDASEDEPLKDPGRTILSPDCKTAATVLYSGWVAVWDVSSRRVFHVFPASNWEGTQSQFRGLAFSPDGRLLATGNSQGVVEVWEIGPAARDAEKSESPADALRGQSKTSGNQKFTAPFGRPKPVGVSVEWIELDCTKCPELAKRFQPDESRAGVADRTDPAFADLEAKAAKRVLVHDMEWIAPGGTVKHTTRVNETNFDLELALSLARSGNYTIIMNASRSEGTPLPASVKPGSQLSPEQMQQATKGIQTAQMASVLRLAAGHSTAIGGLDSTSATANKRSGRKMLVLIIGLRKPDEAANPPEGPPVQKGPRNASKDPFALSAEEARSLDNLLADWEKRNKEIHSVETEFYRWKLDAASGRQPWLNWLKSSGPQSETGILKFAAPDKALMKIDAADPAHRSNGSVTASRSFGSTIGGRWSPSTSCRRSRGARGSATARCPSSSASTPRSSSGATSCGSSRRPA